METDAATADGGRPAVAAPATPEPVALGPCRDGWLETADDGLTWCEPLSAMEDEPCPGDTFRLTGSSTCERLGSPCTADRWATGLPASAVVIYVDGAAASPGDGTRGAPHSSIGAALPSAGAGAVIAIARGTYDEIARVPAGVTLWGACIEETVLASTSTLGAEGTIDAQRGGGIVRNLRVSGDRVGSRVAGAGELALVDVLVDSATDVGVLVTDGGTLDADAIVVRATRARSRGFGNGVVVEDAGLATLRRAVVADSSRAGVLATRGGAATLEDTVVRGTTSPDPSLGAGGVLAINGGSLTARRTLSLDNAGGALVAGPEGTVEAEDVVLRRPQPGLGMAGRLWGSGLETSDTGTLTARRALVDAGYQYGVRVSGEMTLSHVVIRDTVGLPDSGWGLTVTRAGRATVDHAVVERNRLIGVVVGVESALETTTAELVLEDAVVRDGLPTVDGDRGGQGLSVRGGTATLRRVAFARNRDAAVVAALPNAILLAEDVSVTDTASAVATRDAGSGVACQEAATCTVTRLVVADSRSAGVIVYGATLTGADVTVARTAPRECAADTCADAPAGLGVAVVESGHLTLEGFDIADHALAGVLLARAGEADLSRGRIARNPIGINISTAGFDAGRVSADVVFEDNGVNLDTSELPVPDLGVDL
jgi:hypothetical protein